MAAAANLDVKTARTAAVSLVAEAALLRRMLYKNANQHRHALFFQRLVGLRRAVDRMLPERLVERVEDSIAALGALETGAVGEGKMDADVPMGWLKDHVLRLDYLTACAADTQRAAIAATPHLVALVGASFFVPFGTVMIAVAGRLHACASTVETVLCGMRSAMLTLMARNVWRMQRRGATSAATSMVVWQQLRALHLASAHTNGDNNADTQDGNGKGVDAGVGAGTEAVNGAALRHTARRERGTIRGGANPSAAPVASTARVAEVVQPEADHCDHKEFTHEEQRGATHDSASPALLPMDVDVPTLSQPNVNKKKKKKKKKKKAKVAQKRKRTDEGNDDDIDDIFGGL